jgi:hypothetical protein
MAQLRACNTALKVKLAIEHRLGEVLAANVKHGGHNEKQGNTVLPCFENGRPRHCHDEAGRIHN